MVSRRTVLKLGSAGVAASVATAPVPSLGSALLGGAEGLTRAVFDERFRESQAFAAMLAEGGVAVSDVRGDVAALWYGDLRARLEQARLPVVGLTDRPTLFCLEELARDVGMKVRGRIDHVVDARGAVAHRAVGPEAWTAAGARLTAQPGFGRVMASLLRDPTLHGQSTSAQRFTGPYSATDTTTLVSWWMA